MKGRAGSAAASGGLRRRRGGGGRRCRCHADRAAGARGAAGGCTRARSRRRTSGTAAAPPPAAPPLGDSNLPRDPARRRARHKAPPRNGPRRHGDPKRPGGAGPRAAPPGVPGGGRELPPAARQRRGVTWVRSRPAVRRAARHRAAGVPDPHLTRCGAGGCETLFLQEFSHSWMF